MTSPGKTFSKHYFLSFLLEMGLSLDFCLVHDMQMENTGAPGPGAAGQGSRPIPQHLLCVPYILLAPVGLSDAVINGDYVPFSPHRADPRTG